MHTVNVNVCKIYLNWMENVTRRPFVCGRISQNLLLPKRCTFADLVSCHIKQRNFCRQPHPTASHGKLECWNWHCSHQPTTKNSQLFLQYVLWRALFSRGPYDRNYFLVSSLKFCRSAFFHNWVKQANDGE